MRRPLALPPALLVALFFCVPRAAAQPVRSPESGAHLPNPKVQDFLRVHGARYGLRADHDGRLLYRKPDLNGAPRERALGPETAERLLALLAAGSAADTEARLALALESYLKPRAGGLSAADERLYFAQGPDGRRRLSQTGCNVLLDILTAEDGLTFAPPKSAPTGSRERRIGALAALRAMERAGVLVAGRLAAGGLGGAASAAAAFDGAVVQGVSQLESFDWRTQGDPVRLHKTREDNGLFLYSAGAAAPAPGGDLLRVLVAARNPVAVDRLRMSAADSDAAVYREAGLDPALFSRHGAQVVRAVDNLVAVDVPLDRAAALGTALAEGGVVSRPARMFKLVADAARTGPAWPDPLYGVLPFGVPPSPRLRPRSAKGRGDERTFQALHADSRRILKTDALAAQGMDGTGAVVAVVDSGLDVTHPDFEDRVAAYIDLSDSGTKDFVGHGTHVAGSIGGSGKSSQGRFRGTAPGTKFVILKVFGKEGATSEDTLLAALKAAKSLPQEIRPSVVNLSLSGPGDPETGPISAMANEMMVKDNIVVAVAAGNSGPGRKSIGAPGNARHVLTITGTNKELKFPFFPSRGPVATADGRTYNKPDLATVAGDVAAGPRLRRRSRAGRGAGPAPAAADEPSDPGCFHAPGGVISTRSQDDEDAACALKGSPGYRYMAGTSMATPLAAGVAADVVAYLRGRGRAYKAVEVKALMMETAADLKEKPEVQGAGLLDGGKLAAVLEERVRLGLPVGNVAFSIAHRVSRWDEFHMRRNGRFERTAVGILDRKTGHLIHNDEELEALLRGLDDDYRSQPFYARIYRNVQYWLQGGAARGGDLTLTSGPASPSP